MTANALAGDRERCLDAGMDGYLTKPVRPDELAAEVSRWLPTTESRVEPAAEAVAAPTTAATDASEVPTIPAEPVAETAIDDGPLLDRAQIDELRSIGGTDGDFIAELIGTFLTEGARDVRQISAALAVNDHDAVARDAHRLRGSALNLGCPQLAASADVLEARGRTGNVEGAEALGDDLVASFGRTRAALELELEAAA
jgi:HPt (histidine-containing phosphotransfer) domain-containing protein